jgi:hypothetical protein
LLTRDDAPATSPWLSGQHCSKIGQPAHDRVAFLDVPLATGLALEGIQIG